MSEFDDLDLPTLDRSWFVRPDGWDASGTIHGLSHTLRVWAHAMKLAESLGLAKWQRDALHHAALWHDIGRTHDGADYYHGAKSAGRAIGLGLHLGLDVEVREAALFSVTHHSGDEGHAERAVAWLPAPDKSWEVFKVLKDADGLDRVRLDDFDPSYLRCPESHARIDLAWEMLRVSEG